VFQGGRPAPATRAHVTGKIIFTDAFWDAIYACEHGAAGLISVHPRLDARGANRPLPDLTQWRTFRRGQKPLWGFMLAPPSRARQLIRDSQEPVLLHAEVDAELHEGTAEFVTARLPGTDLAHGEIWVLAHPEPGACDNASGCCASLELARTLASVIAAACPAPQHPLPAWRGSLRLPAYYDACRNDLDRVLAGLNSTPSARASASAEASASWFARRNQCLFIDGLMLQLFGAVVRTQLPVLARPHAAFSGGPSTSGAMMPHLGRLLRHPYPGLTWPDKFTAPWICPSRW
jgi:hypothetical protein